MKRRTALVTFGAFPLVMLAACAKRTTILGSIAETFYTLDELTEEAEIIAVGRAASSKVDRSDGIPWTISTVEITRVFKGEIDDTITLRQTGTTREVAEGLSPVVEEGKTYVFYLRHYELVRGEPTGEYVPVTVGVFEVDGDTAIIPEEAHDLPEFPETVDLTTIEKLAAESEASDGGGS